MKNAESNHSLIVSIQLRKIKPFFLTTKNKIMNKNENVITLALVKKLEIGSRSISKTGLWF